MPNGGATYCVEIGRNGRHIATARGAATDVAVIGGGIVGVCTGLALQKNALSVTIYDGAGVGAGASYGNAGLVSVDSCLPISMPGMLAKLPRWLTDPASPLSIDWRYLPRMTPWLWRFVRAGRPEAALRTGRAMRALHKEAHALYRELLGDAGFNDHIRVTGHLFVLRGDGGLGETARRIWDENGVESQLLNGDEIHQMAPALARDIQSGIFLPRNGFTVDPKRLTEALLLRFENLGGRLSREHVVSVSPERDGRLRVVTSCDDVVHSRAVLSAGAWSADLLRQLGLRLPLDTERGYHVMVRNPGIELRLPVVDRASGFGLTPMTGGIRIAGTVELAGMRRPPNYRRADIIRRHAEKLFPGLDTRDHKVWMGFRPSAPDGLPIIDVHPRIPNLHIATAHSHFGMTAAPMTAQVVANAILGRSAPIDLAPYRLARF